METSVQAGKDGNGKFLQGFSGNKAGRPVGCRNKLGEAFLADFYADWKLHGAAVLRTVRDLDPVAYAKIAALLTAKIDDSGRTPETGVTIVNVITGVRG